MAQAVKLDIGSEQDRLTVGAILMKNGYRVWLDKETRPPNKKPTYIVCADRARAEEKTATLSPAPKKDKLDPVMTKLAAFVENTKTEPEQLGFGT